MESSNPQPPRPSPSPALSLDARLGVDTRLWAKVLFTALYALIFALGTAGNALSAHVVLKGRAGPPGRLRYHVLSLALSGLLLLLVSVPVELYNFVWFHYPWAFGDLGCRAYYFVRELCAYTTVLSVASLSAERCLAVCQPLRARRLLSPRRTRRLLSLVWAASLGLALPMAIIMGQKYELETADGEPEPASRVCTVLVSRTTLRVFIQPCCRPPPSCCCRFLGPGHSLMTRASQSLGATTISHGITFTGAIVAVYVFCWMPYHVRRLMYCYVSDDGWTGTLYNFYHYFYLVTNTLFYVSSAVTPVLYNVVSSSFRKLFLKALGSLCREHHRMEP
ncbi:neurotensin receptor type 2 isoform X3 [Halichoerus grypus]|uniref:neurotensin receptor type 2 isoform X3 n=1 Tax=Halichoerus grypus TaxID=9711 RepID=UPI00165954FA|nr:neurotensin receptor type 2 isoform X3 [Halichoerus grypus]